MNMAKHDFGATNIFNITHPETYRCQILHYHAKLSRLYVRVTQENRDTPVFYLLFTDVGYLECPTAWQGANFSIGTQDDCIALMLEVGMIGQAILRFPNAYASITEVARLYTVAPPNTTLRFIASSATMLQQLPKDIE
jgi:hypothetical protein